jgi:hypothetical protein
MSPTFIRPVLTLSAIVFAGGSLVHLVLWYGLLLKVKTPENHRRLWRSLLNTAGTASQVAADEGISDRLVRYALRSRLICLALAALSIGSYAVVVLLGR